MQPQPLYKVTVPGNPIVKKNTQRTIHRGGRSFVYYTANYQQWAAFAMDLIGYSPRPREAIDQPIILTVGFYMATRRRVDISALYEGIQDVLVKAGVLAEDNFNIVAGHDGSRVHHDPKDPRMEVAIYPLSS